MAENGWRVSAHPLNFRIRRHCQPYRMDVNRQQANFGTCYVAARAYSLEQQNAWRVQAGLCHASSYYYYYYYYYYYCEAVCLRTVYNVYWAPL